MSGTMDPMVMPGLGQEQQFGFGGGATDPYLMMLMRRRALAEALQRQPQQPMTHPLQVLGTIAEKGVGAWQQDKAERQYLDYAQKQQQAERALMQEALSGMGQGSQPAPVPMAAPASAPAPAQAPQPASQAFMSPGIEAMVKEAAARHNVPPALARALVMQESGGNPAAVGRAGEAGLSQILPSTARNPGFGMQGVDPASLRDPAANLDFGMQYLAARAKSAGLDLNNPEHVAQALKLYNGGGDPNYAANVTRYMGGGASAPTAAPQVAAPAMAAAQQDQRAQLVERARRLMATGSPRATQAAMQILALAKATPELDRELVRIRRSDGSEQFVPRSQAQGMVSAPEPQRPVVVGPGSDLNDVKGNLLYRNTNDPATTRLQVNTDLRGEAASEAAFGEAYTKPLAQRAAGWAEGKDKGYTALRTLQRFEEANRGVRTGAGAELQMKIGQVAQMFGAPDSILGGMNRDAVAKAEDIIAITNRMAMDNIGPGGMPANNFSNVDWRAVVGINPNLFNTPTGNQRIIAAARAAAERRIEIADAWAKHVRAINPETGKPNGANPKSAAQFEMDVLPGIVSRDIIAPILAETPAASESATQGAQPTQLRWNVEKGKWE